MTGLEMEKSGSSPTFFSSQIITVFPYGIQKARFSSISLNWPLYVRPVILLCHFEGIPQPANPPPLPYLAPLPLERKMALVTT